MSLEDTDELPFKLNLEECKDELARNGKVKCPVSGCQQDFMSVWGLKYHVKRANHQDPEGKFKCDRCSSLFQSRVGLQQHRIAEHSSSESCSPASIPSSRDNDIFHLSSLSLSSRKTKESRRRPDDSETISSCPVQNSSKPKQNKPNHNFSGNDSSVAICIVSSENQTDVRCMESSKLQSAAKGNKNADTSRMQPRNDNIQGEKRKPGRPKKANCSGKRNTRSPSAASDDVELTLRLTECSESEAITPKRIDNIAAGNANRNNAVTPLRTSNRKRKHRTFDVYTPVENKNSKHKRIGRGIDEATNVESQEKNEDFLSASKRGRLKNVNAESNVGSIVEDSKDDSNSHNCNTPEKRHRKSRRVDTEAAADKHVDSDDDDDDDVDHHSSENNDGSDGRIHDAVEDDETPNKVRRKGLKNQPNKRKRRTKRGEKNTSTALRKAKNQTFVCELCGKEYQSSTGLKHHKKTCGSSAGGSSGVSKNSKLKKILASGRRLNCPSATCGAKFTTVLGYNIHIERCGKKMEERQRFPCELCAKEYLSMPGLQYHMNAAHAEPEPAESDHDNEGGEDDAEVLQDGRTRRRAASRAIKKFHEMATDSVGAVSKPGKIKKEFIDQLIVNVDETRITEEQEEAWAKMLKDGSRVPCPHKGCSEEFRTLPSVKMHVSSCGHRHGSYKCLACNKLCISFIGARKHVRQLHVGYKPQGGDHSDSSDEDFKARSSEESEEESEGVEVEEIEEIESDLSETDDDLAEMEEIVVWDKQRKRFKMPRKRDGVKNAADKRLGFGPIGQADTDSYTTTEKWRNEVFKHDRLFPSLRPSTNYWSRVKASDIHQYLPSAEMSPRFRIRRQNPSSATEDLRLALFESTSKGVSRIHGDVTLNVGGPVWAMNWCPVPDSQTDEDQILAISTHRSLDEVHSMHKCVSSPGLIQLWNFGRLKITSASSGTTPRLSLGILHNFGAVWNISWCPSGTWEPEVEKDNQGDGLPRVGLMALACSDGHVRILSIPYPKSLLSTLDAETNTVPEYSHVMVRAKPYAVLTPCALGVEYNGQCGQAWCAKWFPGSMHEKIASGFSDGTVAIWNLLTESPLLKEPLRDEPLAFCLAPILHIKANSSIVKGVTWCPYEPHILVTGSHDRCYKIWNLKSPSLPICSFKRGICHEMHWPVVFESFLSCEDDSFQSSPTPALVRHICFTPKEHNVSTNHTSVHNSTIWSLSVSNWCDILVSGDAAGEVEGVLLSFLEHKARKSFCKFGIYRAYLEKLCDGEQPQQDDEDQAETKAPQESSNGGSSQSQANGESPEKADQCAARESEEPFPKTVEGVFQKYRLVFDDVNPLEFHSSIRKSDPDFRRLFKPSTMQSAPYEEMHPEAIHKVRFNPNKQSFSWLASGGAAGLVRLHLVKQVKS